MPNGEKHNKLWDAIEQIKRNYLKSRTFWQVVGVLIMITLGIIGITWNSVQANTEKIQTSEVRQERIMTTLENIESKVDKINE